MFDASPTGAVLARLDAPTVERPTELAVLSVPHVAADASATTVRFVTVADRTALEEAYASVLEDSATARGRASLAAVRVIGAPGRRARRLITARPRPPRSTARVSL